MVNDEYFTDSPLVCNNRTGITDYVVKITPNLRSRFENIIDMNSVILERHSNGTLNYEWSRPVPTLNITPIEPDHIWDPPIIGKFRLPEVVVAVLVLMSKFQWIFICFICVAHIRV